IMSSRVGDRNPAHCTGVGKALLAYLTDEELADRYPERRLAKFTDQTITDPEELKEALSLVRDRGYAIDQEEHELGVKCVAVPIFNHKGLAAAISVSGPVHRIDSHIEADALIETLLNTAAEISDQMGWGQGVDQLPPLERKGKMPVA
ncbi:MAG: IclR family transcriptional regulator, partial [Anaerolineales bacterium]